jgi:hypothetical protein
MRKVLVSLVCVVALAGLGWSLRGRIHFGPTRAPAAHVVDDAKLLFPFGSTVVERQCKQTLEDLGVDVRVAREALQRLKSS